MFQREYRFTLPKGYMDQEGNVHRDGVMRLATAADEIHSMRNPRVQQNPEYLPIIILSRTILTLGTVEVITPDIIEHLFNADFRFLKNMYRMINDTEKQVMHVTCPGCEKKFTVTMNFEE